MIYFIREIKDYHGVYNFTWFLDKVKALAIYNEKIEKAKHLKMGYENDIKFIEYKPN